MKLHGSAKQHTCNNHSANGAGRRKQPPQAPDAVNSCLGHGSILQKHFDMDFACFSHNLTAIGPGRREKPEVWPVQTWSNPLHLRPGIICSCERCWLKAPHTCDALLVNLLRVPLNVIFKQRAKRGYPFTLMAISHLRVSTFAIKTHGKTLCLLLVFHQLSIFQEQPLLVNKSFLLKFCFFLQRRPSAT